MDKVPKLLDACNYANTAASLLAGFLGWLTANYAGIMVFIAILTYITSFIFNYRKDRRDERALAEKSSE